MKMLGMNRKIILSILVMIVLICGLQGESDAYIDSIKPGPNDTSLIVTFTERIAGRINIGGATIVGILSCENSGTGTYLFEWREKTPQGNWQSVKKTYNYRWFSCSSTTRTESLTIEGLKPGTTYEVRYNSGAIHEGTTDFTTLLISTASELTEATLGNGTVTLTLNNDAFEQDISYEQDITTITDAVTVSGIEGVTLDTLSMQRISDTEIRFELDFDGTDFDTDGTLTFTIASGAIADYTGEDFTAEVPVTAIEELEVLVVDPDAPPIYWLDRGSDKIQRLNTGSSTVEDLVTQGLDYPDGIALDVAGGKMYWTDRGTEKIQRANLDGSNVEDLVTQGLKGPDSIVLDVASGKMYWTDWGTDKIQRANLDGSNVEDLVTQGLRDPYGMALDVASGKMYWIDNGTDKIQRANLNGSNIEDLVTQGLSTPIAMALDVAGGKMYWTDAGTDKIQRANFNGSNIEDLVTQGLRRPYGIALDVSGGKMYWVDWETDKIQRANLDGSTVEDIVTGLDTPYGIALGIPATQQPTPQPDLVIKAVRAEPATVAPGETFRLYATLKNQGTVASAATRVRYYRSTDNVISAEDTQLGSAKRDPLAPDATLRRYLTVTAPTTPGTYYYGVCVDSVSNESNTANNCSRAVTVTVTEPTVVAEDVNDDGIVDVNDLVLVAQQYGQTGTNAADVNGDGVVNIDDLILVAAEIEADATAAPSLHADALEGLTVADVKVWLSQARQRDMTDPSVRRGIQFLESLLASMVPKETALLANYPNPFNPETWIPYQLSKSANVTLHIYAANGRVVRTLSLGHQPAGIYQNRSRAAYWDGRNALGEPVASGLYFYTLIAGDFTATRRMLILK